MDHSAYKSEYLIIVAGRHNELSNGVVMKKYFPYEVFEGVVKLLG